MGAMPNIASVLKAEVSRLARKELRSENEALKKALASQRTEIAGLKRRLLELERAMLRLAKIKSRESASRAVGSTARVTEQETESHRFRASGMAANRKRLGLSAADFGLLVGTTGQSVYAWEAGKSKPREKALAAIAGLRGIGKKEALERLQALKG